MSEKDHLFELINSLKKAEKSYFKKIKKAFGNTDSAILQIYDELIKQESYDEKAILDKLGKESFKDFYSAKKYVLYNEILDALAYSRAKKNDVLWQITRYILHAHMLKEKMLYDDAYKTLQRAYKLAHDHEFYFKIAEINQQMTEILHQRKSMTDFDFAETLEEIRLNTISAHEKSINAERYFILSDRLYRKGELLRLTANETAKKEMKELYKNELLQSENEAKSKTALTCYHFIMYYKFISYELNKENACYHLEKLIDLQELLERFPLRSRFSQMANYVRLATEANLKEKSYQMLQRMQKISDQHKDDFITITYFVHLNHYYTYTGEYKNYMNFHKELETTHHSFIEQQPFNKEIMDLKHCQFMYNFFNKNFKKAYSISHFIDSQYTVHSFKTGRFYEKILKLICAFELNDFDLVQSEIRAIKYLLKSIENPLAIELKIFSTLDKLNKAANDQQKKKIYQEFMVEYNEFNPDEKFTLLINIFKFPLWLKAFTEKTDFGKLFFDTNK